LFNGAIGKVGDEIVYRKSLSIDIVKPILIACDNRNIEIAAQSESVDYSNFPTTKYWPWLKNYKIIDFNSYDKETAKLYLPNLCNIDKEFVKNLLCEEVYYHDSIDPHSNTLFMIMNIDATKGKALDTIAKYYNINKENVLAFGDDYNDLDMLKYAGVSVAMSNAISDVKKVCLYKCLSNEEDGVAKWIEENIL